MISLLLALWFPEAAWLFLAIGAIITITAAPCGNCCYVCPASTTVDVVISGISICGCFQALSTGSPVVTSYWLPTNMVGVNGAFSFTYDGTFPGGRSWSAVIGTIDVEQYEGPPDTQCDVPVSPANAATVDVVASILCYDGYGIRAGISITLPFPDTQAQIFYGPTFPGYSQFDDNIANDIACILNGIGYYTNPAAGGALTASLP